MNDYNRWRFPKNTSSKILMDDFLKSNVESFKNSNSDEENSMVYNLKNLQKQAGFYMFGYTESKTNKFIPSQLNINMVNNIGTESENMLVSLFAIKFPHPFGNTLNINVHVGRIIVKLLTEDLIQQKLYIDEIVYLLVFINNEINEEEYSKLIFRINQYRGYTFEEKQQLFFEFSENSEALFSSIMHEIKYYFIKIFKDYNVFLVIPDPKHNNGNIFSFKNGNTRSYRSDMVDNEQKVSGYIKLNSSLLSKAHNLLLKFSPFETIWQGDFDNSEEKREENIKKLYTVELNEYLETCLGPNFIPNIYIEDNIDQVTDLMTIGDNVSIIRSRSPRHFILFLLVLMSVFLMVLWFFF